MSYEDFNFLDRIMGEIYDFISLNPKKRIILEIMEEAIGVILKGFEGGHHG